jgi:predicted DNA-binding transcriptional regulator AlpA
MNLSEKYGHTLTLKELCSILKISRSTYYSYLKNKECTVRKEGIKWLPDPIPNFSKKLFYTKEIELFLQPNTS